MQCKPCLGSNGVSPLVIKSGFLSLEISWAETRSLLPNVLSHMDVPKARSPWIKVTLHYSETKEDPEVTSHSLIYFYSGKIPAEWVKEISNQ